MILKHEQILLKAVIVLAFFFTVTADSAPEFWNTSMDSPPIKKLLRINYEESFNFQPGLNLFSIEGGLTALFGTKGNQLCAPTAITHAFYFLKYKHNPAYQKMATVPDMDGDGRANTFQDQIRYFFSSCETDKDNGTLFWKAANCMDKFVKDSGYSSYTFMLGPHSLSSLPNVPNDQLKRAITLNDLRYYLSNQVAVILTVGWYEYNPATQKYDRSGGHFFNLYGYDYNADWKAEKIILKVVNPWIDYQGRAEKDMYDDVWMTNLPAPRDAYPENIHYELKGPGFIFDNYKALVENLFVIHPY